MCLELVPKKYVPEHIHPINQQNQFQIQLSHNTQGGFTRLNAQPSTVQVFERFGSRARVAMLKNMGLAQPSAVQVFERYTQCQLWL